MDDDTLFNSLVVRINVINVNDPPSPPAEIIFPGLNYTTMEFEITFIANMSADPDANYGDEVMYYWDFDDSDGLWWANNDTPPAGQGDYGNFLKRQTSHLYPESGIYLVTVKIEDGGGLGSTDSVLIKLEGDADSQDTDKDGLPDDSRKSVAGWRVPGRGRLRQ